MATDPRLVPVAWTPLQSAQNTLFAGCADRAAIAEYGQAVAFEKRVKGFAVGFLVGAVGCVALAVFLKMKDEEAARAARAAEEDDDDGE